MNQIGFLTASHQINFFFYFFLLGKIQVGHSRFNNAAFASFFYATLIPRSIWKLTFRLCLLKKDLIKWNNRKERWWMTYYLSIYLANKGGLKIINEERFEEFLQFFVDSVSFMLNDWIHLICPCQPLLPSIPLNKVLYIKLEGM